MRKEQSRCTLGYLSDHSFILASPDRQQQQHVNSVRYHAHLCHALYST